MCVWESSIFFENSRKKEEGLGQGQTRKKISYDFGGKCTIGG
jgi:hypothetical protein